MDFMRRVIGVAGQIQKKTAALALRKHIFLAGASEQTQESMLFGTPSNHFGCVTFYILLHISVSKTASGPGSITAPGLFFYATDVRDVKLITYNSYLSLAYTFFTYILNLINQPDHEEAKADLVEPMGFRKCPTKQNYWQH